MCPAIGSSYEYDAKGLVTLMTNGRGIKTKYEYNTKGQEISRIVGFGSANALTIKTTWDNSFNLPKTETYPDKTITYDYDGNGNLISQTVSTTN
jgi:YD repeat-containing protein